MLTVGSGPIGLIFCSSCFLLKHYLHTNFHPNRLIIRPRCHTTSRIQPKTPEDSRKSDPIESRFCTSCFFLKHYPHTEFRSNRSIIRHTCHIKLRKHLSFGLATVQCHRDSRRHPKIAEGVTRLVRFFAHDVFSRNPSPIPNFIQQLLYKFTKFAEVQTRRGWREKNHIRHCSSSILIKQKKNH